jgi:hypothetical protein
VDRAVELLRAWAAQKLGGAHSGDAAFAPRKANVDHEPDVRPLHHVSRLPTAAGGRDQDAIVGEQEPDSRQVRRPIRIRRGERRDSAFAQERKNFALELRHGAAPFRNMPADLMAPEHASRQTA